MGKRLVIIGASGHARSVIDILEETYEYELAGCVERDGVPGDRLPGMEEIAILGDDDILKKLFDEGVRYAFAAVGSNRLRKKITEMLQSIGFEVISIISKKAIISTRAEIGKGCCVMPGAVINVNAKIGNGCIINTNSSIDHDCIICDYVHIAPGTAISGTSIVGSGTFVGTNSAIIDGIRIGEWTMIGAGAAVVSDIPDRVLACGVPAKIKKTDL